VCGGESVVFFSATFAAPPGFGLGMGDGKTVFQSGFVTAFRL
jgi:hypothetical protein